MVAKPKITIDWANVIKGLLVGLASLGAGATLLLGGNDSSASEITPRFEKHVAVDSMRFLGIEENIRIIREDQKTILELLREDR